MQPPKVSVVIVTFNQAKFVEQALESVTAQEVDFEVEIIVADDHSQDGTAELIRRHAAKDARVKAILRPQNIGAMANVVGALQEAQGTYVALCEGDDFWTDPTKLARQVELMDAEPDLALCFHRVQVAHEDSDNADFIYPDPSERGTYTLRLLIARNFIQTNSVMYRRVDYSKLPTDVMPLDWFLHIFHARLGSIGFLDAVMATYRRHAAGAWWSTADDTLARARTYGLAQLGFADATLRLLDGCDLDLRPVHARVQATMDALKEADSADGTDLLRQGIAAYPRCSVALVEALRADLDRARHSAQSLHEKFTATEAKYHRARRRLERAQRKIDRLERIAARHERGHSNLIRCFRTAVGRRVRTARKGRA